MATRKAASKKRTPVAKPASKPLDKIDRLVERNRKLFARVAKQHEKFREQEARDMKEMRRMVRQLEAAMRELP